MSAVKALAIAKAQGQRTYTITNNNLESALAQITLDIATENDIRSAVESGKQVTTHQSQITYHCWAGAGYIITDTESGAGAYKISGGADGGSLVLPGFALAFLQIVGFFVIANPALAVIAGIAALLANGLMTLSLSDNSEDLMRYSLGRFLVMGLTIPLMLILTQTVFIVFPMLFLLSFLVAMISAIVNTARYFLADEDSYRRTIGELRYARKSDRRKSEKGEGKKDLCIISPFGGGYCANNCAVGDFQIA